MIRPVFPVLLLLGGAGIGTANEPIGMLPFWILVTMIAVAYAISRYTDA